MKIQNKSAKLWIGLGLLGLIMLGIKSITGPFGGVIVEMFSDAGIIFLLVGIYLESGSKKKSESKGFIPLVVAILIGLTAIGGTVAIVAIKTKNPELAAPKAPVTGTTRDQNGPGELINKIEGVTATSAKKSIVEQKIEVVVNNEIKAICLDPTIQTGTQNSLRGDIKSLCEKIIMPKYTQEEINNMSESIQDRWKLLQTTQRAEESTQRRSEDIKVISQ